jgi:hypothetical protein
MLTGIEEPILESTAPIEYIEDNCLTQFRTFLTTIKAKMVIEGLWQLRGLRENDVALMTAFTLHGINKHELVIINN